MELFEILRVALTSLKADKLRSSLTILGSQLNAVATVPFDWVAIGVFLCVIIGVGFGTYPAYKASNLDPIEALRWE